MGRLYYENKNFAGGAFEKKVIKAVYFGAELLWPHLSPVLFVDPLTIDFAGFGGSENIQVVIINIPSASYTVTVPDWLTVSNKTQNGFTLTASPNITGTSLTDIVTVSLDDFPEQILNIDVSQAVQSVLELDTAWTTVSNQYFLMDNLNIIADFGDGTIVNVSEIIPTPVIPYRLYHTFQAGTFTVKFYNMQSIPDLFIISSVKVTAVKFISGIIKRIGVQAFYNSGYITSFIADLSSITSLGDLSFYGAFASGSNVELDFSSPDFESIGNAVFKGSRLAKIRFNPNATFSIGTSVFDGIANLTELILGKVTSIGVNAFYNCGSISSFSADFSLLTSVADNVFYAAFASTSSIELDFNSELFASIGANAFKSCKAIKIRFNPNATFSIGTNAFDSCTRITELILGKITSLGDFAFYNCGSISSFSADFSLLTQTVDSASLGGTFHAAFAAGSHIEVDFMSEDFTRLGNYTFYNSKVWKVHFNPNAVFTVGTGAFSGCTELVELILGKVTGIESGAIGGTLLQTIRIYNTNPPPMAATISTNSLQAIYVPAASVSAYQQATGWVTYASKIIGF